MLLKRTSKSSYVLRFLLHNELLLVGSFIYLVKSTLSLSPLSPSYFFINSFHIEKPSLFLSHQLNFILLDYIITWLKVDGLSPGSILGMGDRADYSTSNDDYDYENDAFSCPPFRSYVFKFRIMLLRIQSVLQYVIKILMVIWCLLYYQLCYIIIIIIQFIYVISCQGWKMYI